MLKYSPLRWQDMSRAVELWNSCPELDPTDHHKLAAVLFADENYCVENTLGAWDGDRLTGFILGMRRRYPYLDRGLEPEKAWILCQATAPAYRRRGIGRQLLHCLENRWTAQGVTRIVLSAFSPYYFFPGLDASNQETRAFYESCGYICGAPAYWMERDLNHFSIPPAVAQLKRAKQNLGYSYMPFSWEYSLPLLDFASEHFSTGWQHHIRQAIRSGRATQTLYLCLYNGSIAGYLQRGMDGDPYRLGPFGVAPAHRNGGVGTVLVWEMWGSMVENGLNFVYFQSTDQPGRRFYERQGMTVKRTFYHCEKVVQTPSPQ
ncbi:MAG: GNAT family N-acetyltransferase [Clostridium sp.]|nr:GNAT family N-acetyltransferase [Clostridium sp.]